MVEWSKLDPVTLNFDFISKQKEEKTYFRIIGSEPDQRLSLSVYPNENIPFPEWPVKYIFSSKDPFSEEKCLYSGCEEISIRGNGCHDHICRYKIGAAEECWELTESGNMCAKHLKK